METQVIPFLKVEGVDVLGRLPADELVAAVSMASLVESLGAKVLSGNKHGNRLVRRFFIGAMQVGLAHKFFNGVRVDTYEIAHRLKRLLLGVPLT